MTAFIENQYQKFVQDAVKEKTDHTQSLGVEKLREMKTELKDAIDKVPDAVKERIDTTEVWEHRATKPDNLTTDLAFHVEHRNDHRSHQEFAGLLGGVGRLNLIS